MAGGTPAAIDEPESDCVPIGGDWAVIVGVLLPLATGGGVPSPLRFEPSCAGDLVFFLARLLLEDWAYGWYMLPLFDDPSVTRPSVRRGGIFGAGRVTHRGVDEVGEISKSSASPRYRGMPSAPISTLGGLRK
jgi:hypothetical protein